ncbi:triple tyrosine motif-containing protein [Maribacter sp. CXY002]|uniref:helix-turn-helix and ligand-binding sensor domain-containing protein n=1 Tax=Maribacter luteocoastalis TaxID=3407671 RepID=UPI003B677E60
MANSKGLLEYNGAYWNQYISPNESIMRSVLVVDDLIYTGCYMEFGFWKRNDKQLLEYTSISKDLNIDLLEDEEFWHIIRFDDWMVFQSLNRIYIYNVIDQSVSFIESLVKISQIFEINGEIYFQGLGKGLFKINNGEAILFLDTDAVKENEVINVFVSGGDLLILTKEDGLYRYTNNTLTKSSVLSNDILSDVSIYDAIKLKDNKFAIGTIANGLYILNEKWEIVSQINLINGLINNTVLAITEDSSNNIWLGLDNGISYIDTDSPYEINNEKRGILGSVYASAIHNEYLYLGTNQGLFYRKLNSKANFNFIKGTEGQVWFLKNIDGDLLCGHNSGTYEVENGKANKISNVQGTWSVARIDNNRNILLQGNYDGLYVLERTKVGWKLRNKLKGFNNSSRYFETLGNQIFVNHEYKGIFKLDVSSDYSTIKKVTIDSTLKGSDSGIAKYKGELLYAYKKGIFKYDTENQIFVKDNQLSKAYTENDYESGKLIVNEKDNSIWVFTKSNIVNISPTGLTNKERIEYIPLTSEIRKGIIGYENISGLEDDKYLLGSISGYVNINLKKSLNQDFEVHIGKVFNGADKSNLQPQNINEPGNFSNKQINYKISFYTTEFNTYLNTKYQYQLLGLYDEWSGWSDNPVASFENLPYGKYVFNVRSKIGDTLSNNVGTYGFEIASPWYISKLMITMYTIGTMLLFFSTHNLYKQYYKKQRQKLIFKNEKELILSQVQNEREIIKLRNEKLKIDFNSKSKELAASLLSIAKKNDVLRSIREELRVQRGDDPIKTVIYSINKSLKQDDGWDFFQEAFNNADSKFLKNLKIKHPNLTPSDLKLCGYLRLNLSTKEISDLLNITPRSVEIKRYRLRKKLNLGHEDNLVNYILGL